MRHSTSFTLEPITQNMCSVIAPLHALCFDDSWTVDVLKNLISSPGVFGYLIPINSNVLGFIICRSISAEGEILSLAVAPHTRRNGLGLCLINEAKSYAIKNGLNALFLEVAEDNYPAKQLYLKAGFWKVGRRSKYYRRKNGLNVDANIFKCGLTQDTKFSSAKGRL